MKKSLLPLSLLTGLLGGMFLHATLYSRPEPAPAAAATFYPITLKDAHDFSVRHRGEAGYCMSGCTNKEGIFDLSELTITGLYEAVKDIKAATAGANPAGYRCIFGRNTSDETVIMLVGTDINRKEYGNEKYVRLVGGTLPCPTLCDITKSNIVMGDPRLGQDCCK